MEELKFKRENLVHLDARTIRLSEVPVIIDASVAGVVLQVGDTRNSTNFLSLPLTLEQFCAVASLGSSSPTLLTAEVTLSGLLR